MKLKNFLDILLAIPCLVLFFGFIFLFGLAILLIPVMLVLGVIAGAGMVEYTVTEWIPYQELPHCRDLDIKPEEFVWNSPRKVPEEIKGRVIRCQSSALSYDGNGSPLFRLGRYDPPEEFERFK